MTSALYISMETNKEYVRASDNIQDLTGIGYEWLLDQEGNIIAIFFNGSMLITNKPSEAIANEITVSIAA